MKKHSKKKKELLKRILCLVAAVFLLVGMQQATVKADVIWEPYEDDFYSKHYEECKHISAEYLTNGEDGYVTMYKTPESSKEVAKVMNGVSFFVSFSWQDEEGKEWGIIELTSYEPEKGEYIAEDETFGWVLLADMAKVYNNGMFLLEHGAELDEYNGELDDYEGEGKLIIWSYPGSGKIKGYLDLALYDYEVPGYQHLYTDEDGNRWTYISYYYGSHKGWICIDHPEEEELIVSYEKETTKEEIIPPREPQEGLSDKEAIPGLKLAAGLVGGVIAATAALIALLFGKKKK